MSQFVSIDVFNRITSAGLVDMTCALDVYPMPTRTCDGEHFNVATQHIWPDSSILLKPGLTMCELERNVLQSLDEAKRQYESLCARLMGSESEPHATHLEMVLKARGII